MKRYLLLFLMAFYGVAQIPGTYRVTGPVAPPATNSNFGATDTIYGKGGLVTGFSSLSQAQDVLRYPLGRRQLGMQFSLTDGTTYQLQTATTNFVNITPIYTNSGVGYNINLLGNTAMETANADQITSDAFIANYDGVAAPNDYNMPKSWITARSTAIDCYLTNILALPILSTVTTGSDTNGVPREALVLENEWPGFWRYDPFSLDDTNAANIRYPYAITTNTTQGRWEFVTSTKTPKSIPTLSELLATDPRELASIYVGTNTQFTAAVMLGGYHTDGDGGGGLLVYFPGSQFIADGGYVYDTDDGFGQWVRDFRQSANPRWFGAISDGFPGTEDGTDNSAYFTNLVNSPYVLGNTNSTAYGDHVAIDLGYGFFKTEPIIWISTNNTTGNGNYARGSITMRGQGVGASGFVLSGTSNMVFQSGRLDLSDFMIHATPTRTAATVDETQGSGMVFSDIDGAAVQYTVKNVNVWFQPSHGMFTEGGIELAVFENCQFIRNRKAGVRINNNPTYAAAPLFGLYQAKFTSCRAEDNGWNGWAMNYPIHVQFDNIESINNFNPTYNGLGYKNGFIEVGLSNSVGCIFTNPDIEDNRVTTSVKLAASTTVSFAPNTITDASVNFISSGFTTNMLVSVSGTRSQQGNNSVDGVYRITGVAATVLTVEDTFAALATYSPSASTPVTLQASEANIGIHIFAGRLPYINGGTFGSLSAGIVNNSGRNATVWNPRVANYNTNKLQNIIGVWDTANSGSSFGNTWQVMEPDGVDTNGVSSVFYGKFTQDRNNVRAGNANDYLITGHNERGVALKVIGGNNGLGLVEYERTNFHTMRTLITGVNQFGIQDVDEEHTRAAFGGNLTNTLWRVGQTAQAITRDFFLQGNDLANVTDSSGGFMVMEANKGTSQGFPTPWIFRIPQTNGLTGTNVQSLRQAAIIGFPDADNQIFFAPTYVKNGTFVEDRFIDIQQSGALTVGDFSGGNGYSAGLAVSQGLGSTMVAHTDGGPPQEWVTTYTMQDGFARWIAIQIPTSRTITGVKFGISTQGNVTGDNENAIGLYSYSGGTLTQIAITANSDTIWEGASASVQSVAFGSPVAVTAGTYYLAFLLNYSASVTVPIIAAANGVAPTYLLSYDYPNSGKICGFSAETALPASKAASAITVSTVRVGGTLY